MINEEERTNKLVKACIGIPDEAIDGGWNARDMISYAKGLEDAISIAYGYLWHVNTANPNTHKARRVLRDTMTNKQCGESIKRVQELLKE